MTTANEEYQCGYNDGVAAGRAQLAMLLHQWQPLDHPNDESGYCRCDVCSVLYPIQARLINAFQARPPHDDCPRCEIMTDYLVGIRAAFPTEMLPGQSDHDGGQGTA